MFLSPYRVFPLLWGALGMPLESASQTAAAVSVGAWKFYSLLFHPHL